MRSTVSIALALALVTPPGLARAGGWTSEQRATLDEIIALENAGNLEAAVDLATQEFARDTAPPGYRRAVAKRGRPAAEALFAATKDATERLKHLCVAVELMRVYQAELMASDQDREDIPPVLLRLEAQATTEGAPCALQAPQTPVVDAPAPPVAVVRAEGPERPPASIPSPRPRPRSHLRVGVGAGLLVATTALVAGVAGCLTTREAKTDRIRALDERATQAGRGLTMAELAEVHAADGSYARLTNTGTALGVLAGLTLLAGVVVLVLPPRARSKAQAMGAGVRIAF